LGKTCPKNTNIRIQSGHPKIEIKSHGGIKELSVGRHVVRSQCANKEWHEIKRVSQRESTHMKTVSKLNNVVCPIDSIKESLGSIPKRF